MSSGHTDLKDGYGLPPLLASAGEDKNKGTDPVAFVSQPGAKTDFRLFDSIGYNDNQQCSSNCDYRPQLGAIGVDLAKKIDRIS